MMDENSLDLNYDLNVLFSYFNNKLLAGCIDLNQTEKQFLHRHCKVHKSKMVPKRNCQTSANFHQR